MSSLTINIAQSPEVYRAALNRADTTVSAEKTKTGNGLIDTAEEKLAAAQNVSEIAEAKFSGVSAEDADAYLRSVVGVMVWHPAMGQTPITAGRGQINTQSPRQIINPRPVSTVKGTVSERPGEEDNGSLLFDVLKRDQRHPGNHYPGCQAPICVGIRSVV
jgi:hypothetical protein